MPFCSFNSSQFVWTCTPVGCLRMIFFQSSDTGILEKRKIRVLPTGVEPRTYDLPITSSDALPLSYRRLVGAKAIKLGSWDKHPAYCWDLNVNVRHMRNGINVGCFLYHTRWWFQFSSTSPLLKGVKMLFKNYILFFRQVLKLFPESRILACAPSNSAADLVLQRVMQHSVIPKSKMIRLNAFGRSMSSVPKEVKVMYCWVPSFFKVHLSGFNICFNMRSTLVYMK